MGRPVKKTIYVRINEKKEEIQRTEALLTKLNEELKDLYAERDQLEMHQLFTLMKKNNLTIDKAMELLQTQNK